jgi:hypothetical protein
MSFSFRDLNLKDVDAAVGGGRALQPGRYIVEIQNAEVKPTRAGGKMLELQLRDIRGAGSIRSWINLYVPSSERATSIGRSQLKGLLVSGSHKDPDNIGKHGVESIKKLRVGVDITSQTYTKDGLEREGSKVAAFLDPRLVDPSFKNGGTPPPPNGANGADGVGELDDPIPF